jgi:hypothetical protein
MSQIVTMTFLNFVRSMLGVILTPAQRVLCAVAFDGVAPVSLPSADRKLARRIFGAVKRVPAFALAVLALVAGARSGKTYLSMLRLLHLGLTVNLSGLAPGEIAFGPAVAPDMRLAHQALRYLVGAVKASRLAPCIVGETADSITLRRPDGHTICIEVLPATRGGYALRGRTLFGALLDEACFFFDADGYVVNDEELFRAVVARIVRGGQVLVVSTPWTRSGLLYDMHAENFGHPHTAIAGHAPTLLMREHGPDEANVRAIVTRERARDPFNAAREFDALFVDGAGTLLAAADVEAAVDAIDNRMPNPAVTYGATIDVGLRNDATVAMIFHVELRKREGGPPVRMLVVDATRHLRPSLTHRVTLDEVEGMVAPLCQRYRVRKLHGDLHYADSLAPRMLARGIKFIEQKMTPDAQASRATTLAALFGAGAVRLVDDAVLVRELKELRITRQAGGRVSVGAPGSKKKHDDAADCLLLAAEVFGGMHVTTGDVMFVPRVERVDSHVSLTGEWVERRVSPSGQETFWPCLPPPGTPERERVEAELALQGIHVIER